MNYYAVVFLLRPPDLLRRGPFSERENVCNSQENGVRSRCTAIVNHCDRAIVKILRVVNLLRVVFLVRRGPLGRKTKKKTGKLLLRMGVGWPRMSGSRTSGSSKASLGVQVLAAFSFIF